ncbi:hypothetical protein EMG21_28770 [Klebsiella pneumoniae]|nr:hypothetical protein EMG21_28770 [Klebsiella pneumoniae]
MLRRITPQRLRRRLVRMWKVASHPRGWWPRIADPFWRAKYGQLKPWERTLLAGVLMLWEPIADVFGKQAPPPRVGEDVKRPASPVVGGETGDGDGGKVMSAEETALIEAAEVFAEALAAYGQATPMVDLGAGLSAIAPALSQAGDGVYAMATRLKEERPVNSDVIEGVEDVGHCMHDASKVAEELEDLFNTSHEQDRERILNPRVAEEDWDVTKQEEV